ncbi:MAG: hypothetical protein EBZ51_09515 [Synechococcaceae bacterium WB9_2_112]|nr:hypothetical protein [Synechococcaceae bacterium WB9_2_112]
MVQVLNNFLVDRPQVGPPKPDAVRRCFEVGAFCWTVLVTIPIQGSDHGNQAASEEPLRAVNLTDTTIQLTNPTANLLYPATTEQMAKEAGNTLKTLAGSGV